MSESATPTGQFREHWLNPRRKRFWAIVFVLLYTLLGFFLAPVIIKKLVIDLFQDKLGRTAHIEQVKVNPYVLSLEIKGFQVTDKDDVKFIAFDRFFANYQLSSLFKWAFVYKQVQLEAPYLHFERFKTGESRIEHLLADLESAFPPDPDQSLEEQEFQAPRLMIQDLNISNGQVDARDNVPENAVEIQLAPINIHVQELNTLPDVIGQQRVEIMLPNDGRLTWSGSLKLLPFFSEGRLTLKNLKFDRAIAYLKSMLPLEEVGGTLSADFKYRLGLDPQLGFTLEVDDLQTDLENVVVTGLSPATEFVSIPMMSLAGGKMRYPERTLAFDSLQVQQPELSVWRNPDGSISFQELLENQAGSAAANESSSGEQAWRLQIDHAELQGGRLDILDKAADPALAVSLTDIDVKVSNVSSADDEVMPVEMAAVLQQGGSFIANADITVLPDVSLTAHLTTTQIPLSLAQTYAKEFARIEIMDGTLDSDINIEMQDLDDVSVAGSVEVSALHINDTLVGKKLIDWNKLEIDQFEFRKNQLRLSQLVFNQPFGNITINQDRSTNVSGLIIETADNADSANESPVDAQPLTVIVGGILVEEGSMEFADLSLPLPFSTFIANLNGTISTIATNSTTPADIDLEGQVNEYGLARIGGSLNMFDPIRHADVKVNFRNLLMSNLSPYTVEFAGREIDEGKLDLSLVYKIEEGILDGQNDIVLSDLVLGRKVDHPGAANLPLGLAVALLKDSDGVINVDLPVQGDINDPEFKIGGVVWKAITNLITKIVTAPFKLLGNLIGIDSEDLGQFEFLPGRSDLTPPELEKVAQLQQALQERPELVVEISGVTDSEVDSPALRNIRLRQVASERLGEGLGDENEQALMLDERIRNVVEELFKERFPDVSTDELKEKHKASPADNPEAAPQLDELAYATDLWQQLLAAEVISSADLEELATARAESIRTAFLASGEFDEKRVVISDSKQVTSEDGEWVVLELAVAAD